jgi:hypothetical protein
MAETREQKLSREMSHMPQQMPDGGHWLDALAMGSMFTPILGDALGLAADARMFAQEPETRTPLNFGLSAAGILPFVPSMLGHLKGIKRMPKLYHGTAPHNVGDIVRKGLTKGDSSELNIPGSSLSRDPTVSMNGFGHYDADNVLVAQPKINPEDVANLDPFDYTTGQVPDALAYNKPSFPYNESEMFFPRSAQNAVSPLDMRFPTGEEAEFIEALAGQVETGQNLIRKPGYYIPGEGFAPSFIEPIRSGQRLLNAVEEGLDLSSGQRSARRRSLYSLEIELGGENLLTDAVFEKAQSVIDGSDYATDLTAGSNELIEVRQSLAEMMDRPLAQKKAIPKKEFNKLYQDYMKAQDNLESGFRAFTNTPVGGKIDFDPKLLDNSQLKATAHNMRFNAMLKPSSDLTDLLSDFGID